MKNIWDERFATPEYIYGTLPNSFFKQFIDTVKSGTLLLPAEGEGRNALYALQKGWNVTAVDYSVEGRNKALKLARSNGFNLNYVVADLAGWDTVLEVDSIALLYAHFPPETRLNIHIKLASMLLPGGKLLIEAFSKHQLQFDSGGPRNSEMLYSAEILGQDFAGLEIEYLEELVIELDEGGFHQGQAAVVRMIANKK